MDDLNYNDYIFTPKGDVTINDKSLAYQHKTLINNNRFSDATELLDDNNFTGGYRASFFNKLNEKIRSLQIYILNKLASPDELYSLTEPTSDEMEGKTFWIQPYE